MCWLPLVPTSWGAVGEAGSLGSHLGESSKNFWNSLISFCHPKHRSSSNSVNQRTHAENPGGHLGAACSSRGCAGDTEPQQGPPPGSARSGSAEASLRDGRKRTAEPRDTGSPPARLRAHGMLGGSHTGAESWNGSARPCHAGGPSAGPAHGHSRTAAERAPRCPAPHTLPTPHRTAQPWPAQSCSRAGGWHPRVWQGTTVAQRRTW